jgi:UDP-N-acetylmuramate dehydrogenase
MKIEEKIRLAPYTTFELGGPARWFVEAHTEEEIAEAVAWADERKAALFVLGGGSNLLVSDDGFNGLVLKAGLRGMTVLETGEAEQFILRAAAGEDWEACVQRSVDENLAGLECLAGIPGTVGGTPVQNVGAYGQEVAEVIDRVRAFDRVERAFVEFTAEQCGFAYRSSRFNAVDRERYIVTRVDYRLVRNGAPRVRYADLLRALQAESAAEGREYTLAEVAATVRKVRQSKGMLMVAGEADCRSAGSFFKNPVVDGRQLEAMRATSGKEPPHFQQEEGNLYKVPAAWLIEQAGFHKGYALGAAAISTRHTLALTNRGGATATEVLALAARIVEGVEARFGVRLEMEPVRVGSCARC